MWKAFTIELVDPQSFFVLIYTVLTFLVHLSLHVGCFLAILKMTNNKTLGTKMAPIRLFGNFFFNFYSFWMTNELLEKASKGALNYFKQTLKHKLFLDSFWTVNESSSLQCLIPSSAVLGHSCYQFALFLITVFIRVRS